MKQVEQIKDRLSHIFKNLNQEEGENLAKSVTSWINQHINQTVDDLIYKKLTIDLPEFHGVLITPAILSIAWESYYLAYTGFNPLKHTKLEATLVASQPVEWFPESIEGVGNLVDAWTNLIKEAKQTIIIVNPYWSEQAVTSILQRLDKTSFDDISMSIYTRHLSVKDDEYKAMQAFKRYFKSKGAEIDIVMPRHHSKDNLFRPLIHAKVLICDKTKGYIGSANISKNGFLNSFEVGVIVEGNELIKVVKLITEIKTKITCI